VCGVYAYVWCLEDEESRRESKQKIRKPAFLPWLSLVLIEREDNSSLLRGEFEVD
jgi:hypothetical protein